MSELGVRLLVVALALSAVAPPAGAQRTAPVPRGAAASEIHSGILGVAVDSLHGTPLAGAVVSALPTSRRTTTDDQGRFRIDSLSPGSYQLRLAHALIDTLGFDIISRPIEVPADRYVVVALWAPSARTLRRALCPSADTVETPSLLTGRVRDADTDVLAEGAHVSLVFTTTLVTKETGVQRVLRVRRATVKPDGTYVICGLQSDLHGTLQAERGGITTAEVDLGLDSEIVALRSLSIGSALAPGRIAPSALAARDTAPRAPPAVAPPSLAQPGGLKSGNAKLAGTVLDSMGLPLADARVAVTGTIATTVSGPKGEFTLTALPSGTNELAVRRIGFDPVTVPVELTMRETRRVTVHMHRAIRALTPVVVEAARDIGLARVGFLDRKKATSGHFISPDDIARIRPRVMSDLLRTNAGFQVSTDVNGQTVIQPTRQTNGQGGYCVNVFVDRAPWMSLTPGDFDTSFPIGDVAAVETYAGNSVPVEFAVAGKSCATIVIWTRTKVGAR